MASSDDIPDNAANILLAMLAAGFIVLSFKSCSNWDLGVEKAKTLNELNKQTHEQEMARIRTAEFCREVQRQ